MNRLLLIFLLVLPAYVAHAQSETEKANSGYEIVLMSLSDASNVSPMLQRFEKLGYEVQYRMVTVNDTIFSRLTMGGFESLESAEASAMQLKQELDYDSIWVNKP